MACHKRTVVPPLFADSEPSDDDRRAFLDELDEAENIEVSEWEAGFLETTHDQSTFSEGQRKVISSMMDRYKHRM